MLRQGIRETSTIQKYPIGMRFAEGDRVFRYCLADSALPEKRGAGGGDTLHETTTAVVASAGDQDLTVVIAAADVAYVKDQFKNGYINIWAAMADPTQPCLKIKGNDADDGTNVVLHLEEPLLRDVPLGMGVDIHENPYRSVLTKAGGTPFVSVIAIPLVPVTINNFFWGQVWGPTVSIAHADGGIGAAVNERAVYFAPDGSIGTQTDVPGTVLAQYAGFMLADTTLGDDIFYMLQLSP
ncbi:hypothetical protein ES708_17373 [subsurface metagenome]